VTLRPRRGLNAYASYTEGSRAPTSIELGCADPTQPCKLPNAQANNREDILFVASDQTGFGYFKNFGKTRRQGLKVDVDGQYWRFSLGSSYTFLDATFQSPEIVGGSSNSHNDAEAKGLEGLIAIDPGAQVRKSL
jgi:hypothetical protein